MIPHLTVYTRYAEWRGSRSSRIYTPPPLPSYTTHFSHATPRPLPCGLRLALEEVVLAFYPKVPPESTRLSVKEALLLRLSLLRFCHSHSDNQLNLLRHRFETIDYAHLRHLNRLLSRQEFHPDDWNLVLDAFSTTFDRAYIT